MAYNYEEDLKNRWDKYRNENRDKHYPNVLIAGVSGAGKSSLINKIFGDGNASTSDVRPDTQGFHIYYGKNFNRKINLIDSAGYETNQVATYYSGLSNVLHDGLEEQPIHLIWYCISVANKRVEDFDIDVLEKILQESSIRERMCIVFTKCDYDSEDSETANQFRNLISDELYKRNASVRKLNFFETCNNKNLDLQINDLISWSVNALDDVDLKRYFIASQKNDLDLKESEASGIINIATAAAAAVGASPIPFSDAPLLVATQVKMVSSILDVYGLSSYASISDKLIGDIVISQLGKSIVGNLLKFIPGAGSIAGALINGAVASTLTFALGTAISKICYRFAQNALNGVITDLKGVFSSQNISQIMMKYKK